MQCPNCNQTIAQKDKFCRFCGKPVVVTRTPTPPEPGQVTIPVEYSDFGPAKFLAQFESRSGTAWGAHIHTGSSQRSYEIQTRPEGCPEWVGKGDWGRWLRRGLAIWDHNAQRIAAILPSEAIELLEKLNTGDDWKNQGVTIVERHEILKVDTPSRKRSKKKDVEPEQASEKHLGPTILEKDRLRLTGLAAEEFYTYLRANEVQLRRMVEEEEALLNRFRLYALTVFVQLHHRQEIEQFDPASRQFPWIRQEYPMAFICEMPPDRATIALSDDGLWWRPVIERPNRMKHDWESFLDLAKAMDWVETIIPELRAEDEERARTRAQEEAEEKARIAALPKKDLTPYWIEPSALEPQRLSYRSIIELECEPYRSKKTEISFGKYWHSEQEYYTPAMLTRELRLASTQINIEQPSHYCGIYFIRSVAVLYDAPVAAAQAQHIWDQNAIMECFQEGKVIRARYGFEEVETGYCTWLGSCAPPDNPWPAGDTRAEYMTQRAMRVTLLHALDVNGYRAFLEMPFKYCSDEQLLEGMHKSRVASNYVPTEARAESERWLKDHSSKRS